VNRSHLGLFVVLLSLTVSAAAETPSVPMLGVPLQEEPCGVESSMPGADLCAVEGWHDPLARDGATTRRRDSGQERRVHVFRDFG